MVNKFEADYVAIGMWPTRYTGTKTIYSNYEDEEEIEAQARRIIAREGCFSLSNVTITEIRKV